ncbi:MAG: DNA mismatch repair protein MutS [Chlamydiae bacterium CG10_big_fil_rev_8_21_14_0_10_42_34]|nr:MAG: DNA mismatch repair protein MutS [Chlamydiae bacterium CG10_big_fil_rev_8_21_14_0_10_42_34]
MTVTPMMNQWQECKEQAKDALLFFRLGDFYEAFFEDAQTMAKEIGLTLTARQGTPMCGVPFHTAEGYIDKLIAKGYKVAVAEQTEDPKATKGLVKREVVRIVTPGTIVNSQLLTDKKNNFFVSIAEVGSKFGLAILDLTTTEFRAIELEKENALIDELCRLAPREILAAKNFEFLKELSFHFPFIANTRDALNPKLSFDVLTAHFDVQNLDCFGLRSQMAAITAAGSLVLYLKEELNLSLEHIHTIQSDTLSQFMSLDRSTMRNLSITDLLADLLDETCTPMGGRLIRQWVQYPLLSAETIAERQNAIQSFIDQPDMSKTAREALSQIRDLERLMMKISAHYATPRDLFALGVSLSHIPKVKELLNLDLFDASILERKILSALNDSPPLRIGEGEIFKDGYDSELDQLRLLAKDSVSWMARYQTTLREQTGIKTLKVGYTRAFGYYIEVSRAQGQHIPEGFQRRQTLTNAERFITEELKAFEHQVLTAEERSKAIESELYEELRAEIATHAAEVNAAAKIIARSDALLSLAKVATANRWVKPQVDDSNSLEIIEGRHPIIEQSIGQSSFIPNDTLLNPDQQLMLITGPNMAGKSTYIRQVAIITILAQMGSYVPAKSAHIGIIDKIFSRIGASDDLARGQSTFMVEMSETANILNNATTRSLVLLDEIGRGTSTYDGISIAWAVAEYLLTTHRKQAKTLFATHYWELTKLENEFPHAVNFQTAVQEIPSGIVFLRKIIKGGTDKSYGIHVAKLAGLPPKAIKRAQEMLKELEKKPDSQLSLFISTPQEHPAFTDLKNIDIANLTPLQAHHKLIEIKKLAEI